MFYYLIKIDTQEVDQQELIVQLKEAGEDVIPTSGGLCMKTDKSVDEIKKNQQQLKDLTILKVQPHEESKVLSEDVKIFMKQGPEQPADRIPGP